MDGLLRFVGFVELDLWLGTVALAVLWCRVVRWFLWWSFCFCLLVGVVRSIESGSMICDLGGVVHIYLDLGSMLDHHSGITIRKLFVNGCELFSLLTIESLAHVGI